MISVFRFIIFSFLLTSCSSEDQDSNNEPELFHAQIKVLGNNEGPVEGILATLYSDYGKTIEQTVYTDSDGIADFGHLSENTMSFSINYINSSDSGDIYKGLAFYEAPTRLNSITLSDIAGTRSMNNTCNNTRTVQLQFNSQIPEHWNHFIHVSGSGSFTDSLHNGYELEIKNSRCKNDFLISSINPDDPYDKVYGFAFDILASDGASIEIDYGYSNTLVEIDANFSFEQPLPNYEAIYKNFQDQIAWWPGIQHLDEKKLIDVPVLPTKVFRLLAAWPSDGTNRNVFSLIRDDATHIDWNLTLEEPSIEGINENLISWSMAGIQPIFVVGGYTKRYREIDEKVDTVSWEINAPGDLMEIHIPELPEMAKTPDDNKAIAYESSSLSAYYSKHFSSYSERNDIISGDINSYLNSTFTQQHSYASIERVFD